MNEDVYNPYLEKVDFHCQVGLLALGIQSPKLRLVMEPKYFAEKVIGHPNHHLRI